MKKESTVFAILRERYNDEHSKLLTQAKLAEMLGVSRKAVSRYENASATPKPHVLKRYSEIFNVSIGYLSGREDTQELEESTAIKSLGLSEDAVSTLKMISDKASSGNDLMAFVNAFLGNGEQTMDIFAGMLSYLEEGDNPITTTKSVILYAGYAVWYNSAGQTAATSKSCTLNYDNTVRNHNTGQVGTATKYTFTNSIHSVRNDNIAQTATTIKSIFFNTGHAAWNVHAGQAAAIIKGSFTNAGYTVRNHHIPARAVVLGQHTVFDGEIAISGTG